VAPKGLRDPGSTLVRFDQETLPFTFSCTRDAGSSLRKIPVHSLSPANSEGKKNIPLARIRGAFPSCEVTPEALVEKMVPLVRAHGGTFKWGQASMSKGQCRPSII